ncbi:MAG: sigma-70 family RNA polymerase sigma factor [bacterium]|nr:sigma-70 family RNA polymerase sigma factor [Myxococcales bacterium]MCB9551542.1 sigma-70 family RNA polymerase sigma factor [Myxococcales bacterium]
MTDDRRIEDDDLAFARRLADGEADAVLHFEARHRPVVRHALRCAIRRWHPEAPIELDDQVQDFVGFLFSDGGRRLRSYRGQAAFGSWLYTVALRYFQRDLARRARDRRADAAVLTRLPDRGKRNPETLAAVAEEAERVRAAVHALSPGDQLYIRLFFVEGQNASEVGRTLGKGQSAVRMRKMRILEKLRSRLEVPERADTPPASPSDGRLGRKP